MNLPSFSVKRPIFTTMVTLIVVILGVVSLSRLQIDMLPNIELPTLSIRTNYEGASPEVMERLVTQIIEEIVATVPGVEEITSSSSEGRSGFVSVSCGVRKSTRRRLTFRANSKTRLMSYRMISSGPAFENSTSPVFRWCFWVSPAISIPWNSRN